MLLKTTFNFTKHLYNYICIFFKRQIKKDNKKHYLVDCSRRSGLVFKDLNIRDFSTLILLKELFDFDGFCLRHYFPVKNKDGKIVGYSDGNLWKFNPATFFYEKVKSNEFRLNRSNEYETMNNLLDSNKLSIPILSNIINNLEEDYN